MEMFYFSHIFLTFSIVLIKFPYPMIVMSEPSFTTYAFSKASSKSPAGTSASAFLYKAFGSKNITGLGSLIEAKSNPLAWMGSLGMTTLRPGVWLKYA